VKETILSQEVIFANDKIVIVNREDIEILKNKSKRNKRKRIRLCSHQNLNDTTHEMIIVHAKDTYVRPHKHIKKSESFHLIEGRADVVIFNDDGEIITFVRMSDYSSAHAFYYRISDALYHTLLIRSDLLVFHESTSGPFKKADTVFAPWAPEENAGQTLINEFMRRLNSSAEHYFK